MLTWTVFFCFNHSQGYGSYGDYWQCSFMRLPFAAERHMQVTFATLNSSEDTSKFLTLLRELHSELPRSMLEQTFLLFREMIS